MRGILKNLPVIHKTLATAFTSEAGFLVAAEWRRWIELVERIRPDDARLQQRAHLENPRSLVSPHAGRESVHGIVRLLDGLFESAKGEDTQHRAENFLARDAMALRDTREYGRLVVVAPCRQLKRRRLIHLRARSDAWID